MFTFKSDYGRRSGERVNGSYCFVHDLKPCSGYSSSLDFQHDSRLNHRGLRRGYSHDEQNVLDTELLEAGGADRNVKLTENQLIEEHYTTYPKLCCSCAKNNGDSWFQEFESTVNDDMLPNVPLMDLEACNSIVFEQSAKLSSDLSSHLVGLKKTEPWWHSVDKGDLAGIASQTSSRNISNCDCLGVQSVRADNIPDNLVYSTVLIKKEIIDKETKILDVANRSHGNLTSINLDNSLGKQGLLECKMQEPDGTFSTRDTPNTAEVDSLLNQELTSGDLNRTELLEALCHSQTRARNAEKLAQEACDEKDRVISLFFRQASILFAYRQWLRLLQLETLCLHLGSQDPRSPLTTLIPCVGSKGMTERKNHYRVVKKEKVCKRKCHISRCAIAFAVGLSLGSAGLLVGWTIGWLFPGF